MRTIKRIFKQGAKSWIRNKTVSVSSIFILTITLLIFSFMLLLQAVFNNSIQKLENKVDISVYFLPDLKTEDENIANFVKKVSNINGVSDIKFINKEDAYNKYREENINNKTISDSLSFIGENPFGDRLTIKAENINSYENIYNILQKDIEINNLSNIIYKINYIDIKDNINNLENIISWFYNVGLLIIFVFVFVSVLIIYNTTRISIFVFRNEIGVMKLVGASNFFIRGPFLIESAISGLISAILAITISYPASYYMSKNSSVLLGGFDILKYFESNILTLFYVLFVFSLIVSIISSFLATSKYLNK